MSRDSEHLKLLSVFYYIGSAFSILCGCAPLIYFLVVAGDAREDGFTGGEVLAMRAMFGAAFLLCGAMAVCLFLTGKYLTENSHYKFCFVMACVVCLSVPLGTTLGVLTMTVLLRPSVKSEFGVLAPSPVPAHS